MGHLTDCFLPLSKKLDALNIASIASPSALRLVNALSMIIARIFVCLDWLVAVLPALSCQARRLCD